jgi:3-hydroxybutyrate dehydrogenase
MADAGDLSNPIQVRANRRFLARPDIRVALVTGASRGIGRAISIELVRNGVEVYGIGRDQAALTETEQLCRPLGSFHTRVADVRSEADLADIMVEPRQLDLCINNAGIARVRPFTETPLGEVQEILDINVLGGFHVMQAAAKRMASEGGGRIVTIASTAAVSPAPKMAAYCASKHAASALSKTLAEELEPQGVQVTSVYPGFTGTYIIGRLEPEWVVMDVDEVARTIVTALVAAGTTVRIAELHLQPVRTQ